MADSTPVSRRAPRPPAPALPGVGALDETHQAMLRTLEKLDQLLAHVDENGPDAVARASAAEIHAFFSDRARQHHADEEALVFPRLLAVGDDDLVQQVRRLQQDHGWLEEDWLLLGPQLEAIAGGYNWYDRAMLGTALPVFAALCREHIALEEGVVYPAARRLRAEE